MATDREISAAAVAMAQLARDRRKNGMEMPSRVEEAAAALKAAELVECSMVERVARAINPVWVDEPGFRDRCLQQARAAIEAMREPTEEMKVTGAQFISNGVVPGPDDAWTCWNAMIDIALSRT